MSAMSQPMRAALAFENDPFAIFYTRAWRHVVSRRPLPRRRALPATPPAAVAAAAPELPTVLEASPDVLIEGVAIAPADLVAVRVR